MGLSQGLLFRWCHWLPWQARAASVGWVGRGHLCRTGGGADRKQTICTVNHRGILPGAWKEQRKASLPAIVSWACAILKWKKKKKGMVDRIPPGISESVTQNLSLLTWWQDSRNVACLGGRGIITPQSAAPQQLLQGDL